MSQISGHKQRQKRHRTERIFKASGLAMLCLAAILLVILVSTVSFRGLAAFRHAEVRLPIKLTAFQDKSEIDYRALLRTSLAALFPEEAQSRRGRRNLMRVLPAAHVMEKLPDRIDHRNVEAVQYVWLPMSDTADDFLKSSAANLPDRQKSWLEKLEAEGNIRFAFNTEFFTAGDSRNPEHAGIYAALTGSLWLMMITFLLSFPVGVLAAIYLEEFAPANRWSDFIEININNLASVPSIIFGLMGLALFLNWFGLPRSSPLVGGMVLSLMTLPTIIIATRAALAAVPPSIREAALGIGASHMQSVFHHVVPLALPGILTGTIIGMSRALGETAPLLMIGMVAFITDTPQNLTDPASVLPVQIYIWSDSPERGFADKASAAIMILLLFLISMNAFAVFLRRRFAHRW